MTSFAAMQMEVWPPRAAWQQGLSRGLKTNMSYMMCRREEVFSYELFVPALGSCGRTNKAARSRLPEIEQRPGIELGTNWVFFCVA